MRRGAVRSLLLTAGMLVVCSVADAQISLSSAVDLALRNDPKIKMARADVDKAKAMLSESKDAFVPAVSTSGGIGKSIGVPLAVPVVFSITAQSLVINFSQINYVRAADAGADAAGYALAQVQSDVVQDTARARGESRTQARVSANRDLEGLLARVCTALYCCAYCP